MERTWCSVRKRWSICLVQQGGSHFRLHPSHLMNISKVNKQRDENKIDQIKRKKNSNKYCCVIKKMDIQFIMNSQRDEIFTDDT